MSATVPRASASSGEQRITQLDVIGLVRDPWAMSWMRTPAWARNAPTSSQTAGKASGAIAIRRHFKIRQTFQATDKLKVMIGGSYNVDNGSLIPIGGLMYEFGPKLTAHIDETRLGIKKGWDWSRGPVSGVLSAEAGYLIRERKPELSLSLDNVKPLKYYLGGIAAVLLLNVPLSLNNKEVEFPLVPPRIKGFVCGSLKKTGWLRYRPSLAESSTILDLQQLEL